VATARFDLFAFDISRAKDLVGLGQAVGGMTYGRVDASDLYRAALAQAVAALDAYVHGVVLDRAVAILLGKLVPGSPNTKVGLHFNAVQELLVAATPADVELAARTHVAQRLALETFQRADDVASALAMVGVAKLWSTAFPADPEGAKKSLSLIVGRRNRIVHSCDGDPLNPGTVTPLSDADALGAIETIETIVGNIDPLC
jgi:hypothetical protein